MNKSILIGFVIAALLLIVITVSALNFGNSAKFDSSMSEGINRNTTDLEAITEPVNEEKKTDPVRDIKQNEKGTIQQAQSGVSFRIIEPLYIPSGYIFDNADGKSFNGTLNEMDMASLSYKSGDEQLTIKETIIVKTGDKTLLSETPNDTREIVNINGIEGRFSEENGMKLVSWKIGNLSMSIRSWKNDGINQVGGSLSKEEMIKIASSIK